MTITKRYNFSLFFKKEDNIYALNKILHNVNKIKTFV